jgi:hypothetical protein
MTVTAGNFRVVVTAEYEKALAAAGGWEDTYAAAAVRARTPSH